MTVESEMAAEQLKDDFNRRHHHPGDKHALVVEKFPTAMANKENDSPGEPEHWWISDDTGAVLSGLYESYPSEEAAWEGAYLAVVARTPTQEQLQIAAFLNWKAAGSPLFNPEVTLANWNVAVEGFDDFPDHVPAGPDNDVK